MADDKLRRMAMLLRALEDLDREAAEYKTEWKDRRVKLENELAGLRNEVLDGQAALPLAG